MRVHIAILSIIAGVLLAVPVSAEEADCWLIRGADTPSDTADDVEVCRDQVWITEGETKAANVDGREGTYPTWDRSAPDTSVTGGAGAGYLGSSLHQVTEEFDPTYTPRFEGTTTGHIDNVLVEMHLFPLQNMAEQLADQPEGGTFSVDANLYIDGELVAVHGGLAIELEDAGDAVKKIRFCWVGLYDESMGDGEHDIRLELVGTGLASEAAVFVWDTTEVPSNIVFNATDEELDGVAGQPFIFGG